MPDGHVRLEIAFEGGQALSVSVPLATAEDLERALAGGHDGLTFEAEGGRYTVSVGKIVFVKRSSRESRVGFGSVG